jgi:hypothetical protein
MKVFPIFLVILFLTFIVGFLGMIAAFKNLSDEITRRSYERTLFNK